MKHHYKTRPTKKDRYCTFCNVHLSSENSTPFATACFSCKQRKSQESQLREKQYDKDRYSKIKESFINSDPTILKQCRSCNISKPLSEFYPNSNSCKQCSIIKSSNYYYENQNSAKEYQKNYRNAHKANPKKIYNSKSFKEYEKQFLKNNSKTNNTCSKCGQTKTIDNFYREYGTNVCIDCWRNYQKNYDKVKRLENTENNKKSQIRKLLCILNKKILKELFPISNNSLSDKIRKYQSKFLRTCIKKLSSNIPLNIRQQTFMTHLFNSFDNNMNWNNYGINGWHLDHIVPLANFNLNNLKDYKIASHYLNLQPLWDKDNNLKGASLPNNYLEIIEKIEKELKI